MKIISLITLIITSICCLLALCNCIILICYDKYLWAAKVNYKFLFPKSYDVYQRALREPIRFIFTSEQKDEFCRGNPDGLYIWKSAIDGKCALFENGDCLIPGGPLVEDIIKKRNSCPK